MEEVLPHFTDEERSREVKYLSQDYKGIVTMVTQFCEYTKNH